MTAGTDTMRIAVIGAGGVGGSFGAALAKAGNDVTFVARGAHLAAMRARGLSVLGPVATPILTRFRPLTIRQASARSITSCSA